MGNYFLDIQYDFVACRIQVLRGFFAKQNIYCKISSIIFWFAVLIQLLKLLYLPSFFCCYDCCMPRCLAPFYEITYLIKWVKTSWTCSNVLKRVIMSYRSYFIVLFRSDEKSFFATI